VLEMKVPHGADWATLKPLLPVFLCYVLSFLYVGIYWNNHHHLLKVCGRVTGGIMWANLHLLFWLSLLPFATGWAGENHFAAMPTAAYGFVLFMAAVAYFILVRALLGCQPEGTRLAEAIGSDRKGIVSPLFYAAAIPIALIGLPLVAFGLFVLVAVIWFVPDSRIERTLST